jgi:hypothetical protein
MTRTRSRSPGLDQGIDHPRQGLVDRQRHVVGQRLRRRPRTALAAVDRDEIGSAPIAAPQHGLAQLVHELPAADGRLDADRLAGASRTRADHVEQLVGVGEPRDGGSG